MDNFRDFPAAYVFLSSLMEPLPQDHLHLVQRNNADHRRHIHSTSSDRAEPQEISQELQAKFLLLTFICLGDLLPSGFQAGLLFVLNILE